MQMTPTTAAFLLVPSSTTTTTTRTTTTTKKTPTTTAVGASTGATPLLSLDDHTLSTLIAFFPTRDAKHQQTFCTAFGNSVLPIVLQEPGFVSCHVHASLDGQTVALYEQWTSDELALRSYQADSLPTAIRTSLKYVLEVNEQAVNRHLYQIVASSTATPHMPLPPVIDATQYPLVHFGILSVPPPAPAEQVSVLVDWMMQHLPESSSSSSSSSQPGSALVSSTIHKSIDSVQVVNYGQWAAAAVAPPETTNAQELQALPPVPQLLDPAAFEAERAYWQNAISSAAANNNNHPNIQQDYRLYYLVSSHVVGSVEKNK
ncbi:hypothetical protein ACA910_007017 [Epithemia clementina (nom. ined.)]